MTEQQTAPQPPAQPQQPQPPAQPQQPELQITQPLISFNTTAPEPQQTQQQPQQAPQIPPSYQSIIDQQNEQIAALMAQNQALNGQITQMVQNGAQFAQPQQPQQVQPQQFAQGAPVQQFPSYYEPANPMQQFNTPSLASEQDFSLEGLAEQIGKKE